MRNVILSVLVILAALPLAGQREAAFEARKNDFDYLLGDWEFTAVNKQWGKSRGLWSAVRLADGQILDEYRITAGDGSTIYVTTTLRNYNKHLERWELVGADPGGGLLDFGTARRAGAEVHIEQRFNVGTPEETLWHIRYYDIGPERFSWTADISRDGGKTWTTGFHQIEARRIGPARRLDALTTPQRRDRKAARRQPADLP